MAMARKVFFILGVLSTWAWSTPSLALEYNSVQLYTMDYEKVREVTDKKIYQCNKLEDDDAYESCVTEVLKIALGRPEQNDGGRTTLFSTILYRIDEDSRESILQSLVTQAIDGMSMGSSTVSEQATFMEMLKNLLAEQRPFVKEHRDLFETIAKANIEVSSELRSYRRQHGLSIKISPSDMAKALL